MSARRTTLLLLLGALGLRGAEPGLPLPEAPVRILIPDAAAFEAALTGGTRAFLLGSPRRGDPVVPAWRRTPVGSKLEAQWLKLNRDLPWTWATISKLQPRAVGLAILEAGHLEAVLVIVTALPVTLPPGVRKVHGGVPYALVAPGAADGGPDVERRMGLAWARLGERLLLATSERALKLALDEAQAGRGFQAPLPGFATMELDLDALRKDRYFRREFLFPEGPERGRVRVALRQEAGRVVEVREGAAEPRGAVFTFEAPALAAAGWEPQGQPFWPAFRRGLLEPVPTPGDQPVPALAALPAAAQTGEADRYGVDFTRPQAQPGAAPWEEGDLAGWKALLARQPVASWGYWVTADGVRRLVFPWPQALDAAFLACCQASVARRGGGATTVKVGACQELQVGPGLPALALRRQGAFLWVAPAARDLQDAPMPRPAEGVVRWAKVSLEAVRAEAPRWAKAEGPPQPEQVRPLSDRVLGLLGWFPATTALSVERRSTPAGWTERVVFAQGPP
jgi:hypothetical protein